MEHYNPMNIKNTWFRIQPFIIGAFLICLGLIIISNEEVVLRNGALTGWIAIVIGVAVVLVGLGMIIIYPFKSLFYMSLFEGKKNNNSKS